MTKRNRKSPKKKQLNVSNSSSDSPPSKMSTNTRASMTEPLTKKDLIETLQSLGLDTVGTRLNAVETAVNTSNTTLSSLDTTVKEQSKHLDDVKTSVSTICSKVDRLEKEVGHNNISCMIASNYNQQNSKARSVRIVGFNLAASSKFPEQIAHDVFENLLKVVISRFDKNISNWTNYIENVHTIPGKTPKVIVVSFFSTLVKEAVMRHKRKAIEEMGDNFANVYIYPDLTTDFLYGLRKLRANPQVENAWFAGKLRYKLKGSSETFTAELDDHIITAGGPPVNKRGNVVQEPSPIVKMINNQRGN